MVRTDDINALKSMGRAAAAGETHSVAGRRTGSFADWREDRIVHTQRLRSAPEQVRKGPATEAPTPTKQTHTGVGRYFFKVRQGK